MGTLMIVTIELPRRSLISMGEAKAAAVLMIPAALQIKNNDTVNLHRSGRQWHLISYKLRLYIPPEDLAEELERLGDCLFFISAKDLKKAKAALEQTSHKVVYFQSDGIAARKV